MQYIWDKTPHLSLSTQSFVATQGSSFTIESTQFTDNGLHAVYWIEDPTCPTSSNACGRQLSENEIGVAQPIIVLCETHGQHVDCANNLNAGRRLETNPRLKSDDAEDSCHQTTEGDWPSVWLLY